MDRVSASQYYRQHLSGLTPLQRHTQLLQHALQGGQHSSSSDAAGLLQATETDYDALRKHHRYACVLWFCFMGYQGGRTPTSWPHTAQSGQPNCRGPEAKPHPRDMRDSPMLWVDKQHGPMQSLSIMIVWFGVGVGWFVWLVWGRPAAIHTMQQQRTMPAGNRNRL